MCNSACIEFGVRALGDVSGKQILDVGSYNYDGSLRDHVTGQAEYIGVDVHYGLGEHFGRVTRDFPHGRSCGIIYDRRRDLIWGTDTNGQVCVLRPGVRSAGKKPMVAE